MQGVAALIEDPAPVLPALPHPRLATRQRLTQQQIWVAQHIDLIKQAVSSTTRGEFDDRVESLLQHAPPGSTVQPCTDNTHDIAVGNDASVLDADMDDATSNEAADTDDIAGISQSTVQRPDRKLQRMDRHIQHGDFNKARQALVGQQLLMLVPLVFESDCGVNIPHPNIHDNCRIMIFWPTVLRQWIM